VTFQLFGKAAWPGRAGGYRRRQTLRMRVGLDKIRKTLREAEAIVKARAFAEKTTISA